MISFSRSIPLKSLRICYPGRGDRLSRFPEALGTGLGRGMVVIQTNATSSFHVSFSHEEKTRDQDVPCLRASTLWVDRVDIASTLFEASWWASDGTR